MNIFDLTEFDLIVDRQSAPFVSSINLIECDTWKIVN